MDTIQVVISSNMKWAEMLFYTLESFHFKLAILKLLYSNLFRIFCNPNCIWRPGKNIMDTARNVCCPAVGPNSHWSALHADVPTHQPT